MILYLLYSSPWHAKNRGDVNSHSTENNADRNRLRKTTLSRTLVCVACMFVPALVNSWNVRDDDSKTTTNQDHLLGIYDVHTECYSDAIISLLNATVTLSRHYWMQQWYYHVSIQWWYCAIMAKYVLQRKYSFNHQTFVLHPLRSNTGNIWWPQW